MLKRFENASKIRTIKMIHEVDLKNNSRNFSQTIYEYVKSQVTAKLMPSTRALTSKTVSFPRLRFIFRARIKRRAFDGLVNFHDWRVGDIFVWRERTLYHSRHSVPGSRMHQEIER